VYKVDDANAGGKCSFKVSFEAAHVCAGSRSAATGRTFTVFYQVFDLPQDIRETIELAKRRRSILDRLGLSGDVLKGILDAGEVVKDVSYTDVGLYR